VFTKIASNGAQQQDERFVNID